MFSFDDHSLSIIILVYKMNLIKFYEIPPVLQKFKFCVFGKFIAHVQERITLSLVVMD